MDWQIEASAALPPEKNIISRAVSLFRDRSGFNEGLKISVEKRIPLGGGLGGGSSDAAATLLGLNRLFIASSPGEKALNMADLLEMGAELGSDVPFFLYNTPAAWVSGRGEIVQPLNVPESVHGLPIVLVNPGFPSDTGRAYQLLDRMRERHLKSKKKTTEYTEFHGENNNKSSKLRVPPCSPWLNSLYKQPRDWQFFNDFLTVFRDGTAGDTAFSEEGVVYQQIIDSLRELGADFAGLSGSGSTCFGIFSRHNEAESARKALLQRYPFVIITFSLAS
jgi:4-diphosphocytidyl-2-C-methyl-D-erythritol kinase